MFILPKPIPLQELKEKHNDFYHDMLKIVVDLKQGKIAVNADLHYDLEQLLLEQGSKQEDLWGANLYFENEPFIEYTSLINIRPSQDNFGMEVQDEKIRDQMKALIESLILR